MGAINPEMLRDLLSEFTEKEEVTREEINVITQQIGELEKRIDQNKTRLESLVKDRERVLAMRDRYLSGNWPKIVRESVTAEAQPEIAAKESEPQGAAVAVAEPAPPVVSVPPAVSVPPVVSAPPVVSEPAVSASSAPSKPTVSTPEASAPEAPAPIISSVSEAKAVAPLVSEPESEFKSEPESQPEPELELAKSGTSTSDNPVIEPGESVLPQEAPSDLPSDDPILSSFSGNAAAAAGAVEMNLDAAGGAGDTSSFAASAWGEPAKQDKQEEPQVIPWGAQSAAPALDAAPAQAAPPFSPQASSHSAPAPAAADAWGSPSAAWGEPSTPVSAWGEPASSRPAPEPAKPPVESTAAWGQGVWGEPSGGNQAQSGQSGQTIPSAQPPANTMGAWGEPSQSAAAAPSPWAAPSTAAETAASAWGATSTPTPESAESAWGQPSAPATSAWGEPAPAASGQDVSVQAAPAPIQGEENEHRSSLASAAGGALISPVRGRRKKEGPAFDWGQSEGGAEQAQASGDEDENVKKLGDTLRGLFNK